MSKVWQSGKKSAWQRWIPKLSRKGTTRQTTIYINTEKNGLSAARRIVVFTKAYPVIMFQMTEEYCVSAGKVVGVGWPCRATEKDCVHKERPPSLRETDHTEKQETPAQRC